MTPLSLRDDGWAVKVGVKCLIFLAMATVIGLLAGAPAAEATAKGAAPVEWWTFDEQGGGTAYDQTSPYANGTLDAGAGGADTTVGQMWTRQGKIGGAMKFDGTDDHITATDTTFLRQGNDWTVSAWIKIKSPDPGSDADRIIVGKQGWHGGLLRITDTVQFSITNTAGTRVYVSYSPTVGAWYHYEGTYTSSNGAMNFYVNGASVGTATFNTGTTMNYQGQDTLYIGGSGTDQYHTFAEVDDVRIYNYLRSAEQVLQDYNGGAAAHLGAGADPNEGTPPVLYFNFDEKTGTTVYDRSGNGYNGTFTNSPSWETGKYGSAVNCDSNDYINLASPYLDIASAWTIVSWFQYPFPSGSCNTLTRGNGGDHQVIVDCGGYLLGTYDNVGGSGFHSSGFDTRTLSPGWHHLEAVGTGGNTLFYIDGRSVGTANYQSTSDIRSVGAYFGGGQPFGTIDEFKVYNYARSAGQIAWDYNRGKPVAHYRFDEGAGKIAHNEASTADTGTAPIAWWRLDEGSGTSAADYSGNGKTGTLGASTAAPTWAAGKIGSNALSFDDGDTVSVGTVGGYSNTATIEAWVNHTASVTWDDIVAGGCGDFLLGFNGSNQLRWGGQCSNPFAGLTYTTSIDGAWHHVAATYDGSTAKLYVDGAMVSSGAASGSFTPGTLSIGSSGNSEYFTGSIDDVRIFNYARTAEQVYNDYKTTQGTLVGDTKFVDGKMGKALTFDGSGDYVNAGNDSTFNITGPLTVETWAKFTSLGQYTLVSKWGAIANANYSWLLFANWWNSGEVNFLVSGNGTGYSNVASGAGKIAAGSWYHIVGVYDTSSMKLYLNGNLVATNSSGIPSSVKVSTIPLQIGVDSDGASESRVRYFNGQLDDVRVYNYARTAEQVLQDYNAGGAARLGTSTGEADPWGGAMPIAAWKLDENTGAAARDASGNGKDGTLTNGVVWASGKYGSAVSFDGVDDVVNLGTTTAILPTGTNPFTVSLWVKPTKTYSATDYCFLYRLRQDTQFFLALGKNCASLGGDLVFAFRGGNAHMVDTTVNYDSLKDSWHHIDVVYNGGAKGSVSSYVYYLDGVTRSVSPVGGAGGSANDNVLGADESGGSNMKFFGGAIDDFKVYNYARSAAQIAWDYNRGKPVANYRFEEGSGTTAYDASGNSNNATITIGGAGSQTTIASAWTNGATGKFGKAMSFDGTDDYVNTGSGLDFAAAQFSSGYTIASWVKPSATPGSTKAIFSSALGTSGTQWQVYVWYDANTKFGTSQRYGGNQNDFVGSAHAAGSWYHVAVAWDGTTTRLYVNGVLENSASGGKPDNQPAGREVRIGNFKGYANSEFSGLIDDVRVYNYARTAEQVQQDYLNGAAARLGD